MNKATQWSAWVLILTTAIAPQAYANEFETAVTEEVKPFTQAEIKQGMAEMQQRLLERIETWGKTLQPSDFERTWRGRILNKPKRQEVCGIFQGIVNETYAMALNNQARLSAENRELLNDRNAFIQALGYENNIVDTKMGFNCRLK